jgi:hypothetical protein
VAISVGLGLVIFALGGSCVRQCRIMDDFAFQQTEDSLYHRYLYARSTKKAEKALRDTISLADAAVQSGAIDEVRGANCKAAAYMRLGVIRMARGQPDAANPLLTHGWSLHREHSPINYLSQSQLFTAVVSNDLANGVEWLEFTTEHGLRIK